MRSIGRAVDQELDRHRLLGLHRHQPAVADFPACILQQPHAFAQVGADRLGIAAGRIGVGRGEDLGRHLVLHGFEDRELLAFRQSARRELGALEIAADAGVLPEEELLVHLLEIERVVERAAHPRIAELGAPGVEDERLHAARVADREFFQDHALLGARREVVTRRPVERRVLGAPVDIVALERFQRDGGVAEIFEPELVEVVAADIDVEVLAPIVLHPLVDHGAAGGEALDPIRAAAERRLKSRLADVALVAVGVGAFPPVLGQHIELADDQRQLAIAGRIEGEGHVAVAGLLHLGDVAVVGGVLRMMLLERLRARRSRRRR